jgi:hypothetical protein
MVTTEINQLISHNSLILGHGPECGLRRENVFCIAKTGQKIKFTPHQEVAGSLALLMEQFLELNTHAQTLEEVALSYSYFWLGFIGIHPFMNGNGRTAKAYLIKKAQSQNFELNVHGLDGILLKGNLQEDMNQLIQYFITNLNPRKIA